MRDITWKCPTNNIHSLPPQRVFKIDTMTRLINICGGKRFVGWRCTENAFSGVVQICPESTPENAFSCDVTWECDKRVTCSRDVNRD